MSLDNETIKTLSQNVCETMLQSPMADAVVCDRNEEHFAFTRISGAWSGVIAIDCPGGLARQVASMLFSTPANALTPDDLRDGILELANVVGGNIKALLPEPCRLSLPSQTSNDLLRHYRHMQMVTRVDVPAYSHQFTVTVLKDAA